MSKINPKKLLASNQAKKRIAKPTEKLQPIRSSKLDDDYDSKSIIDAIDRIQSIQWNIIPQQLNQDFQKHIENYRNFVPKVVSRFQIYSLIPNNQTFIDQQVDILVEDGVLKKFILHDNDDLNDLLMKRSDYDAMIDDEGFKEFIKQNPKLVKFPKDSLTSFIDEEKFQKLVKYNFLEILPQTTSKTPQVKLSIPKYGYIINLYQNSKKFIIRTISRTQWKEIKHNELYAKWESNKLKFKDFKGLNIYWILHWLIGEGVLEAFKISDGTGYKLIRQ